MLCQLTFTTSRARRISLRSVHSGLARAKLAYCPFVDCSNTATISSTTHGKILGLWNSAIRCFDVIKASNVDTLAEHEHHGWDDSPQHQCHVQPAGFLGIECCYAASSCFCSGDAYSIQGRLGAEFRCGFFVYRDAF